MSAPICIYHKDCSDGTASAAVFLKKYPGAQTYPFGYGYAPEEAQVVLDSITSESVVYTIDCCILVEECLERGAQVTAIDHHIGVSERMYQLATENPRFTYVFDNEKSGASLAWSYFFPDEELPRWLLLVEDKDLWKKRYIESDFFSNWTYMQVNKPDTLQFLFESDTALDQCIEKGKATDDLNRFYTQSFVEKAIPVFFPYKNYKIPMYNSTYLQSILGNLLVDNQIGVCAIYVVKGDRVRMSVRSIDGSLVSALEVAQSLGGGGHRNASGCEISLLDFVERISA